VVDLDPVPGGGQRLRSVVRDVVRTECVTAIVATHDPVMHDVAERIVDLRDDGELFDFRVMDR
jgi:ABC-type lipoprotein export system ATPase subunit